MKLSVFKLALIALLASASVYAQNTACHSPAGANAVTVAVSTTAATTLVPSVGGQDVHVCLIEFTGANAGTVLFQGSDGTRLAQDTVLANAAYFVWWDGQLDTRRAAAGSSFQMQFSNAPAATVYVTVIYYMSPANSSRQ